MSLSRKFAPILTLVGTTAVLGACDLGGASSGPPGGTISVSAIAQGTSSVYVSASAFFIARLDTSNGSQLSSYQASAIPDLGNDECKILDSDPVEQPIPEGLDVGDTVVLETGSSPERITLNAGGEGYYSTTAVINAGEGKDYSVTLEGTSEIEEQVWADSLHMPDTFQLNGFSSGTVALNATSGKDLSWEAAGGDAVVIYFNGSTDTGVCVAADDGSFKVPAEFAGDLGTSGYFTISSISESKKQLKGRSVHLVGTTGVSGNFTVTGGTPPPPSETAICNIVWVSPNPGGGSNVYIAEMPIASFSSGSKNYSSTVVGVFMFNYEAQTDRATASSGAFSLTVEGTLTDDNITFSDTSANTYTSDLGVPVTGGTGSFSGKLSADGGSPTQGTGTVAINYNGTALTIGTTASYSRCFEPAAFAPMTPAEKVALILGN